MIALYVAAELLAENGQKAASDIKMAAAEKRRMRLREQLGRPNARHAQARRGA